MVAKNARFKLDLISSKGWFFSKYLDRKVHFRFVAPPNYWESKEPFPVLLMNDGQDFFSMNLEQTLASAYDSKDIVPFVYFGLSCNEERMREYGTASSADFKGRGDKAHKYTKFVVEEFMPFVKKEYNVSERGADWVFCGMSLGGLSAFDIAYNHTSLFGKVGVFSGSFWWRKKAYVKNDLADRSRIILDVIKNGVFPTHLKFWFQCGTQDEKADRNNSGTIDAIEDTLDVIKELQLKGYSYPGDIIYVEVEGGKHDLPTWGKLFPQFLQWAFTDGTKSQAKESSRPHFNRQ